MTVFVRHRPSFRVVCVVSLLSLAWLAGCATPRDTVVFVTKTSLGLDVDSNPPSASFAYDRVEGYVGPRFNSATAAPVAGSIATNGKLIGRSIRQTYATGHAAKLITLPAGATAPTAPIESYSGEHKVMFFGTSTVLGLKFAFSPSSAIDSFTLGYKRKEASFIPITESGVPSVLASVSTEAKAESLSNSDLQVEQFFATGVAADALAADPAIVQNFKRQSGDLVRYKANKEEQATLALESLTCVAKLADADLPDVWKNVGELRLLDDSAIVGRLNAAAPKDARALYTRELGLLAPDSPVRTGLMTAHRNHVCKVAS